MVLFSSFDSHCHLAQNFSEEHISALLSSNPYLHCLSVSTTLEDIQITQILSQKYHQQVFPAYGLHPWFLPNDMHQSEILIEQLNTVLRKEHSDMTAIGEIGLDFHPRISVNHDVQIYVFQQQLAFAAEYELPVSIHAVKSHPEVIKQLKRFPQVKGVIHGFYGSPELALSYTRLGFKLGVGPALFRNPEHNKLVQSVKSLQPEYFFYETDYPNTEQLGIYSPANVLQVMQKVAELRNEPLESLHTLYRQQIETLFHVKI